MSAPTPNRPGQKPYSAPGTTPLRRAAPTAANQPLTPEEEEERRQQAATAESNFDPFALLDQVKTQVDVHNKTWGNAPAPTDTSVAGSNAANPFAGSRSLNLDGSATSPDVNATSRTSEAPTGTLAAPGARTAVVRPGNINAHAFDTDPNGGLHTSHLETGNLTTGNLNGGPTPVGTTTNNAVYVAGGGNGRTGEAHPAGYNQNQNVGAGAPAGGGGDGGTYVAIPQHDATGRQTGWQYVTPDQANWNASFGHLPGTAAHPTLPDPNMPLVTHPPGQKPTSSFPQVPSSNPAQPVTHTVGAGETAFFNGKPVPAGGSVTVTGQNSSVVTGPTTSGGTDPNSSGGGGFVMAGVPYTKAADDSFVPMSRVASSKPLTVPTTSTAVQTGTPAAPAPAITQNPTLPAPNFPQVPQPTSTFNPGSFAPAPSFALNTGAPPSIPSTPPLGSDKPIPGSTVAGSTITADDLRTPQPPAPGSTLAAQSDFIANNPAAQQQVKDPTVQPAQAPVMAGGYNLNAYKQPPTNSPPVAPAAPAAPSTPSVAVTTDPNNRNAYIGTPDYRSQRQAPSGLMTNDTTGSTAAAPLPGEPGGSSASATSSSDSPFPKTPGNPFAAPSSLTLGSTAPGPATAPAHLFPPVTSSVNPTASAAPNPEDDALKKQRLASLGNLGN